jgi:hypothetical protein
VFRIAEDSDEESPLRTSAPDFYPTLCQSATTFPEVIEIVTDDDEFGSLRYHSVIPKKRIWKTKKTPAVVLNDEVIEISD